MSSTVLFTMASESNPNKTYEVCQDTSNGGRLWCRVAGTAGGCASWTVGWKRQGYDYHTCKHQRNAIRTLGLTTTVRDGFEYATNLGLLESPRARDAVQALTDSINARRSAPPRINNAPRIIPNMEQRTARASGPLPSLEQVRKATPRATEADLVKRSSRRRLDDE